MANISFNEMIDKLSGKFEGLKTTVQEGKLRSASLREVIDKTIRENSERIRRCAEEKNALDETKEIDSAMPSEHKPLHYEIHHDFVCFKRTKISHQDIANSGVKVDDLDNYPMLVRDLVEEKPNSRDVQEKEEIHWYSRMAPMEVTFGVKFLNRYKGEQNNGN